MKTKDGRLYSRPFMRMERFTPNGYVAGCERTSLQVLCAPVSNVREYTEQMGGGTLYYESNGQSGLQLSGDSPDQICNGAQTSSAIDNLGENYYMVIDGVKYLCFESPGRAGYHWDGYQTVTPITIYTCYQMGYWGNDEYFHLTPSTQVMADTRDVEVYSHS